MVPKLFQLVALNKNYKTLAAHLQEKKSSFKKIYFHVLMRWMCLLDGHMFIYQLLKQLEDLVKLG